MKETYTDLDFEIIEFESDDVITTSNVRDAGTMPDDGNSWSPLTPVP